VSIVHALAKLAGKTTNFALDAGARSRGPGYDDFIDLLRGAIGRIPARTGDRVGQALLLARWTDDQGGLAEAHERACTWFPGFAKERGWKAERDDERLKRCVWLAIYEVVGPSPHCPRCNGRGEVNRGYLRRLCPQCEGSCAASRSERWRARMVGVDHSSWRRRWAARYERIQGRMWQRYSQAMAAIHAELNVTEPVLSSAELLVVLEASRRGKS